MKQKRITIVMRATIQKTMSMNLTSIQQSRNKKQKRRMDKDRSTASKQNNKPKKERRSVLILSDSIPKHVNGLKMHKSLKWKDNITVKAFGGSTIKHMEHYSKPPLERNPELVILHIGTNDIKSNKSPSEIALYMHDLAKRIEQGE